jgi:crotonobetainyl-CoA:carnitine CoA-transferase CaiB-like acyl-CoA transferase
MAEHPQYWANGYLLEIDTPHLGHMRVPGPPIHMSATPPHVDSAGPILGMDTEDILQEAGYSWDDIVRFKESGAIRTA